MGDLKYEWTNTLTSRMERKGRRQSQLFAASVATARLAHPGHALAHRSNAKSAASSSPTMGIPASLIPTRSAAVVLAIRSAVNL